MTIPSTPRTLAVWGLLGFPALYLFFAFCGWILPTGGSFVDRSGGAPFTQLVPMAMPVVAVLLAITVQPVLAGARLIATIALVEYAFSLIFGVLTFLIGLGSLFHGLRALTGYWVLHYLVLGVATLALVAIAAFAVYTSFTSVGGTISRPTIPRPTSTRRSAARHSPPPPPAPQYPGGED